MRSFVRFEFGHKMILIDLCTKVNFAENTGASDLFRLSAWRELFKARRSVNHFKSVIKVEVPFPPLHCDLSENVSFEAGSRS
jgi:hypothetical protein